MPFTVDEIDNIANAAIDYHLKKGDVTAQTLQNKPLLKALRAKEKNFPGGKELITKRVKFDYTTQIQGFSDVDEVGYENPTNIKTVSYPWKLIHAGITFSMHELAKDGISVTDSEDGANTTEHSDREMTALANILEDKLDDMQEGVDRGFNTMYWRDGTQDANLVPGVTSIVVNDPTAATTVGGLDQSAITAWRNRAQLAIDSSTAANLNLVTALQQQFRQVRRYGGNPRTFLAGSDWLDAFEKELRSKGNFTLDGWAKSGRIDASVADVSFKGVEIEYDPTLDDLSKSKYGYLLDLKWLYPMVIEGENMKKHAPARPENKYVFFRALTWMGGLVAWRRNVHLVTSIL